MNELEEITFNVDAAMNFAAECVTLNEAEFLRPIPLGSEERTTLAIGAFWVVHEHHATILGLLKAKHLGSAFALLRPCFEALVRGIWLQRCTDGQLAVFKSGRDTKKVEQLLRDCGDTETLRVWKESERSLHQFTHVSYQLLVRRLSVPGSHEGGMVDVEICRAINQATSIALIASIKLAKLTENSAGEKKAHEAFSLLADCVSLAVQGRH